MTKIFLSKSVALEMNRTVCGYTFAADFEVFYVSSTFEAMKPTVSLLEIFALDSHRESFCFPS